MATITLRANKGSPLTNAEVDANFTNINNELAGKLTANQTITLSGDVTGSGGTAITTTLANSGVTAGTYNSVTVNAKGLVTAASNVSYQPLDADLTAIAGISATSGLLKKTAADTWTLDTNTYLTGNQSITLSGDASGSGSTAIAVTLANSGVTAGTYNNVTVDAKGRVTSGSNVSYLTSAVTSISFGSTGLTPSTGTTGAVTVAGTLVAANGGTGQSTYTVGNILYASATNALSKLAIGTSNQVLTSSGTAPQWSTLDLTYLPDSAFKKSVRAATTANITLSAAQTIDGIALVSGDRVLVKNQTAQAENGIYEVAAGAWTRPADADSASKIAGALVNVDSGTANGGKLFETDFKTTDTLGTTAMTWNSLLDSSATLTAGNLSGTIPSAVLGNSTVYIGTTAVALNRASANLALTGITSIDGSAATLTTGRTIGMTGDVTWTSGSFNGSENVTGTATLANSGVTAGTYTKVTVDAKGRVTTGASLASADLPTYTGTLTSSQVTTALGYTPYNSSNPSGYITSAALSPYAPLASPAFTGTASFTAVKSAVTAVAASAIDCATGNYFTKTATGALSWTVSNVPATGVFSFLLELTNGGTGTQTWFTGIKWPGGTAPTLTASGVDLLGFITDDGGTTWRGVQLMKDSK